MQYHMQYSTSSAGLAAPTLKREVSLLGVMGTPVARVQKAVVVPCSKEGGGSSRSALED